MVALLEFMSPMMKLGVVILSAEAVRDTSSANVYALTLPELKVIVCMIKYL
jgi:hypothetical protein